MDTNNNTIFDGYIRECPDLIRPHPALVVLCSGYSNAFTIDPEEFDRSLPTDNKKLSEGLVFVIWKWKWESGDEQEQSSDNEDVDDPYPPSDEEDHQDVDDKFESSLVTHSVIFKCVGTNKCQRSQEILAEAARKLTQC